MSGLTDLLATRVPRGTYHWRPEAPEERNDEQVRRRVEGAGWRHAHLDAPASADRAALLDALGPALGLEGYHGRNLDALEECVRALTVPVVLVWDGWQVLARSEPRTLAVVRSILVGDETTPGTWVLLRGDGPPVDVPGLR